MNINSISNSVEWQSLLEHCRAMRPISLKKLFNEEHDRFKQYSLGAAGILLDYSNNHCNQQTLSLLLKLADSLKLSHAIEDLLTGKRVNVSEKSPALHTALRNLTDEQFFIHEKYDILMDIRKNWDDMERFSQSIHHKTASGQNIKYIVHVGIGGSHLGPEMVLQALADYYPQVDLNFHFVANLDQTDMKAVLAQCQPESTLFVLCSKSFATRETLANLSCAIDWMRAAGFDAKAISQQLVAVSAAAVNPVCRQLLNDESISIKTFPMWDWVSGRYSLWSAIGLTIVLAFGMPAFKNLLKGAHEMDKHFRTTDLHSNLPVILGLLGVWYNNFFKFNSQAIIPYSQALALLPDYLQQLHMESLGKSVSCTGQALDYATGGAVWGGVGTNSQHSFHQLLLQGTAVIPSDFILPLKVSGNSASFHEEMIANCLAQSEVFSFGYQATGNAASQRSISGNRPHNLLMLETMQAESLGALLALYEHKVYVQSVIWQINAFDQWGIQRGKVLAKGILRDLRESANHPRLKTISEKIYD